MDNLDLEKFCGTNTLKDSSDLKNEKHVRSTMYALKDHDNMEAAKINGLKICLRQGNCTHRKEFL